MLSDTDIIPSHEDHAGALEPILELIASLSTRSSCFSDATRRILQSCGHVPVDMPESQKGKYAVALTLCELSSAGLPGPKACQRDTQDYHVIQCIQALERKPQWWTSYSGYFRDVSRMCYIARSDLEAGHALQLHRNLTEATRDLLLVLRRQTDTVQKTFEAMERNLQTGAELQEHLSERLRELVSSTTHADGMLQASFETLLNKTGSISEHMQQGLSSQFAILANHVEDILRRAESRELDLVDHATASQMKIWSQAQRQSEHYLRLQADEAQSLSRAAETIDTLDRRIETMQSDFEKRFVEGTHQIESAVSGYLEMTRNLYRTTNESVLLAWTLREDLSTLREASAATRKDILSQQDLHVRFYNQSLAALDHVTLVARSHLTTIESDFKNIHNQAVVLSTTFQSSLWLMFVVFMYSRLQYDMPCKTIVLLLLLLYTSGALTLLAQVWDTVIVYLQLPKDRSTLPVFSLVGALLSSLFVYHAWKWGLRKRVHAVTQKRNVSRRYGPQTSRSLTFVHLSPKDYSEK